MRVLLKIQAFAGEDEGVSLIEYALLAAFISLVGLAGLADIANALIATFTQAAVAMV